jgi:hypothetical protein
MSVKSGKIRARKITGEFNPICLAPNLAHENRIPRSWARLG